ncbi:hypothetical protein BT93_F2032 [Corymbia citriodora subsp. variegata]|nr:hypothetical protein BT93_F2032 [Corymbia citriodora subsp. variegata]
MSNRHSHAQSRHEGGARPPPKSQTRFVPKSPHNGTSRAAGSVATLSGSLRGPPSSDRSGDAPAGGRVRPGEGGGDWVPSGASGGRFVNYLPQDEAVASGLGAEEGGLDPVESQRVVDLLNRELSRLLKLKPREFWREVASDTSLHEFLDSFLKYRSRWYDFPHRGAKGIVAGVIVGELELSHRVFMVLYRISSNRAPGARAADALSPNDHEVLLQEKKLLDLPKLLDICAIYGHENEDLTRLLVCNALKVQPWIHDNLISMVSHILSIVQTMYDRCSTSLELLFSSGSHEDHVVNQHCSDFLEVMDFINDAVSSMDAFVTAYKFAGVLFSCPVETSYGNEELLPTLVKLHDSFLPSLRRGFRVIFSSREDSAKSNISLSLKMLSMRIVAFGWKLLDACYLSDELFEDGHYMPTATKMFPAKVEDPVIRADIVIQTFRELNSFSLQEQGSQNIETFLQSVEKNYQVMSRLRSLQDGGWICMDKDQFQYLSGILMSFLPISSKESPHAAISKASDKVQLDENSAILESRISQIRDLFPDYGKGYLAACLEVYDENPEQVIQRILEGTLHEDLQSLDPSLETIPVQKTTSTLETNNKGEGKVNDKGKGKLSESVFAPSSYTEPVVPEQREGGSSLSSSYSAGRFVRKSQADTSDSNILDHRNEKDSARTSALISQYEYEDEYDDSFDDLGLGGVESAFEENEILGDKINSSVGKSSGVDARRPVQDTQNAKWGSRKKPQYYVKDGKNYSYKVEGSIAVANADEASLVTQAQSDMIYGLGRGGNLPLGAVKKLMESQNERESHSDFPQTEGRGGSSNSRGRGRRGGGRHRESNGQEDSECSDASEANTRGDSGNQRGRGRRGGGRNHYRKDRAMNKHFSGLSGY